MDKELFEKLQESKIEHGYFYSDGIQFLHVTGSNTEIKMFASDKELLANRKDIVLIHNHYLEKWTLSARDINFMICNDIKKIIAVTYEKTYILKVNGLISIADKQDLIEKLMDIVDTALKITNNYDDTRNEYIVNEFVKYANGKFIYETIDNDSINLKNLMLA